VGVFQTSGSNAQDITTEIMSILEESKPDFPSGIDYIIPYLKLFGRINQSNIL
jgi:HAE1 family hydrophobic/amphiphilic exporter-1